jgi:hypothetical protein
LNIGQALLQKSVRLPNVLAALLVVGVVLLVFPVTASLFGGVQKRWFLESGHKDFESVIASIMTRKAFLTSKMKPLDKAVHGSRAYGRTNADGSITIIFQGAGNWPRAGYVYYSGDQAIRQANSSFYVVPGALGRPYVHLTNGWYTY